MHSSAGGGLNGAHSCLAHPSQLAGMWKEIWTNSWPLSTTVWPSPSWAAFPPSREDTDGGAEFSSGLRDSPSPA